MVTSSLPTLALLTLCCCVATVHAFAGCHCLRTISHSVPYRVIKKIEMIPSSGHCRQPETILTRRNGSKVCINPEEKWFQALLSKMHKGVTAIATSKPHTSFQTSF